MGRDDADALRRRGDRDRADTRRLPRLRCAFAVAAATPSSVRGTPAGRAGPAFMQPEAPINGLISATVLTCLLWLTQSNAATKKGTQMKKIGEGLDD